MKNKKGKYDDIINLPHHVSNKYPQMSLETRSAQFAPFAALTGYDEVVKETARLTNNKKEIDEELKNILDEKLKIIQQKINTKPEVTFTYFIQDLKKKGGKYVTITEKVKKIDKFKHIIVLENENIIPIIDITDISGDIIEI